MFSLSANIEVDEVVNEYSGFVRPLKNYVKQEVIALKTKMNNEIKDVKFEVS